MHCYYVIVITSIIIETWHTINIIMNYHECHSPDVQVIHVCLSHRVHRSLYIRFWPWARCTWVSGPECTFQADQFKYTLTGEICWSKRNKQQILLRLSMCIVQCILFIVYWLILIVIAYRAHETRGLSFNKRSWTLRSCCICITALVLTR